MDDTSKDLLARLNALKPTSITLDTAPSIDVGLHTPESTEDKLSQRLKRLRAGDTAALPKDKSIPRDAVVVPSRSFDIDELQLQEWQQDGAEQSVDELLAELKDNEQMRLNPDEPGDVARLLQEAQRSLASADQDPGQAGQDANEELDVRSTTSRRDSQSIDEEREADEYVQKVLAELTVDPDDVPSQSSAAIEAVSDHEPPSYEYSELEARMNKLSLGPGLVLPSAPDRKPAAAPVAKHAAKLPTYTDEDIEGWCCICNEDGEVRCLGCDEDVYCQACWNEGHGNGPRQERGHKAVVIAQDKHNLAAVD